MKRIFSKTIIITGATSGIGLALTEKLAALGANLILISRSEHKLFSLKADLNQFSASHVQVYPVDLIDRRASQVVFQKIIQSNQQIDAIINNAGLGIFEAAHLTSADDIERMFQLNVHSIIDALTAMIPVYTKQGHGHIINIASFAGKMATPKSAVYSASKAAIIAYSNAVRLEIETKDILVTTVNLGPVRTPFFNQADPSGTYQKAVSSYMLEPSHVADKIIKNLFKRKREINLPWWMAIGAKIHHQFPTLTEKLLTNQFNKK